MGAAKRKRSAHTTLTVVAALRSKLERSLLHPLDLSAAVDHEVATAVAALRRAEELLAHERDQARLDRTRCPNCGITHEDAQTIARQKREISEGKTE